MCNLKTKVMAIMTCKDMIKAPLDYAEDYLYVGLGEYLAWLIVCVPLSFIVIYPVYRILTSKGTLKEVSIYIYIQFWFERNLLNETEK